MKRLLFILLPALTLAGCSPVFYTPPSQNVPLLTDKHELTASSSFVESESTGGMDVKVAYAVTPHVGIVAGGNGYFPASDSKSNSSGSGGLVEAGAGYFTTVSKKFVFETYGLLGYGWMKNRFPQSVDRNPETDGKINANLFSIAAQPSFGFKTRYFEAALSVKSGFITYTHIGGNLIEQNADQSAESSQQQYLADHKNNFMLEPAITLRGGLDFLKIQLQAGRGFNVSHTRFPQDEGWVTFGLSYRWNRQ